MVSQEVFERLNDLATQYEDLNKVLKLSPYNAPRNEVEEKEKVFAAYCAGKSYNPQFTYQAVPQEWFPLFERFLFQLRPENNLWERHLYEDVRSTLDTLDTLRTHEPAHITASTIRKYGLPQSALVATAEAIIADTQKPPNDEEDMIAEEAARFMKSALNQSGLQDWNVVIEDTMNARMSVRGSRKELAIRSDKKFSSVAVKRLLVHEIGTHVFRKANGQTQSFKLLALGLVGHLTTEEGLATYHERKFGLSDTTALRRYALRVLAAYYSLTHSFFDVFTRIAAYTELDDAFSIVTRAKRGFTDTSQYGSHIKDKVYLEGFISVKEHLNTFPEDYSLLMSGKVSLSMLPDVRDLKADGMLTPPTYLPETLLAML